MSTSYKADYCYLRLSLEDKDVSKDKKTESDSISNQRNAILEFVKNDADISNQLIELIDDGYSGTNTDRPAFKQLIELINQNKVRTLIVKDLSRLARDYVISGYYLDKFFPLHQIRFISLNESYDSNNFNGITSGEAFALTNISNQFYSSDISTKIKSVVNQKKASGEFVYGTAPFGYKKGNEKNTIIVDVEASIIVKYIFKLACDGITLSKIAKILNDQSVITPSVYLKNIRGNYKTRPIWTFSSVKNIIENRIYTGDTEMFKSHVKKIGSNQVNVIPREKRELVKNTHEAIISIDSYYKALSVIKSNVKTKKNENPSVLAKYIYCGECMVKLTKGRATNKNYKCPNNRYVTNKPCNDLKINDDKLQKIVLNAINQQLEFIETTVTKIKSNNIKIKSEKEMIVSELNKLNKDLILFNEKKMQLYEEFMQNKISKDIYLDRKKCLLSQEEILNNMIVGLNQKLNLVQEEKEIISPANKNFQNEKHYEIITSELMKHFIEKIIIINNDEINIIWNFSSNT